MNFDFPNYTFSAIISIFAAIVGMAYPLIHNTIQKIDEKYDSEGLADSFINERTYRLFQVSLYISIIFAILSPLLLLGIDNAVFATIWLYAHLLVTLWLIISTIRLYNLMQIYIVATKLHNYLTRSNNSLEYNRHIRKIAEIARYSAYKNRQEIYLNCMYNISRCIDDLAEKNELQFAPSFYYSQSLQNESYLTKEIKSALAICTEISNSPHIRDIYKTDASYINALLHNNYQLSQGIYDIIWRSVTEAIRADNKGWFKQYWLYFTQHNTHLEYRISKNLADWRERLAEEKERHLRFHAAIGGLLIHHKKIEWINEILFYSLTLPYSYPLCPNRFGEWLDIWNFFEEFGDPVHFMHIQCFYPMADIEEGVDQDSIILFFIEKYIGILFLRLWKIDGTQLVPSDIFDFFTNDSIEKLEYWKSRFERLEYVIEAVYNEQLNKCLDKYCVDRKEAIDKVHSYVKAINDKITDTQNNPQIDENKRRRLKDSINEAWENRNVKFFKNKSADNFQVITYERKLKTSVPISYIGQGYEEVDFSKFIDAIIVGFNSLVLPVFNIAFGRLRPPKVRYNVQYNDVGKALRKLKLSKDFVVLCNDFYIEKYFMIIPCPEFKKIGDKSFFDDAEMIEYNTIATHPFIIILRKRDIPYITFDEGELEGLEKINSNKPLYSNLAFTDATGLDNIVFAVNASVHFPDKCGYVKIELPYSIEEMDLPKIQHIESLI